MRRGDIHLVDFEPAIGAESDKRRPAVIVSNDAANIAATRLGRGVITVVPLTSNVAKVLPFQVALASTRTGLSANSKAQAEQVRAVDVVRVGTRIGLVPFALMASIDEALRLHLDLA